MRNIISKFLFTLLLLAMSIGSVWADESISWAITTNTLNLTPTITPATDAHLSNASSTISLTGFTQTSSSKTGYAKPFYNTVADFDASNKFASVSFDVEDDFTFTPASLDLTVFSYGSGNYKYKAIISDTEGHSLTSNEIQPSSGAEAAINFDDITEVAFEGTVTIKLYAYNYNSNSSGKRIYIKSPIAISGSVDAKGGSIPVAVTGITIAPSSSTIKVGKTVTLGATITPSNATDKAVTWSVTSGDAYAEVNATTGVVTGKAAGTATVTATAHDGSGVTQTATVTVEECPTSGTIFSMNITAAEGTTYTGNNTFPALIDATYVGGAAYSGSKSGTNRTSTIDANGEYPFSANSELAIKVVMDCDFAEGDIIDITTSSTKQIKIQKVVGTDLYKTVNKTYTIPESSPLIGENVFYLMRDKSESTLGSLTVTRPVYRTITLEYADGATADGSLEVIDGTAAVKPADPTWAHHRFDGWYNGASPYDWSATVSGDLTLTAHWTQLYTITYAAGDGTATGNAPTQVDKAEGETFTVAANTFVVAGKDFEKWNDGTNDYLPDATYTVGTENVVLTAQWKAEADKYTVIFKDGETTLDTKLVEVGSNPSDAGVDKTKALSTFAAWQKECVDIALDDAFWATVVKDATVTLTARWSVVYALDVNFKDGETQALGVETVLNTYHYASDASDISFESKGLKIKTDAARFYFNVAPGKVAEIKFGNISGATYSVDGGAAETLSTSQQKATYSASAQSCVMTMTTGAYNIVEKVVIHDPYTVTFNANGGDDVASLQGKPTVNLPSATNGTESFMGWYLAADGDDKVGDAGDEYTPTANIELFAHWEAVSTDARLASITFSSAAGTLSPAFDPEVVNYTYTMPYPTADVPQITGATAVNAGGSYSIVNQASAWGETAVIRGVAASTDTKAYNITMKIAPKDGICLVWGDITADNTITYNESKSKIFAASDVTLVTNVNGKDGAAPSGIKFQTNDYVHLTGAFLAGDVLALDVTYGTANKMYVYKAQDAAAEDVIGELDGTTTPTGLVKVTLTENATDLWLVRGGISGSWNPHVDYVAVYRPMNPILKKVTVNSVEGAPVGTTVTIEVPFTTSQSQLEAIAFDWISNSDAWTAAHEPVATNAWEFGVANTVTLTDKDNDQTVYTVTVNKAVASTDATLSALTVNGQAVTLVPGQFTYDVELPHGTSVAPTVVATANHIAATATVVTCTLTGATINVVPESGVGDQQNYTLNFTINPWEDFVIFDGSTMTDLAASPGAHGLTWEVTGFTGPEKYEYSKSNGVTYCADNNKTYTTVNASDKYESYILRTGGSTKASRNFKLTIPKDYVAKVYLVFGSHSEGSVINAYIDTEAGSTAKDGIFNLATDHRYQLAGGMSEIIGQGDYYINATNSTDFAEIRVLLRPGYARTSMLGNGVYGTICVPNNVALEDATGATFYELAGKVPPYGKIAFDEITSGELEEGVPYVFQSLGDKLVLFYGNDHVDNPQDLHNGMYGTFTDITLTELDDVYYFAQKALWSCTDLTSLSVPANRAYVKLSEIPDATPTPAPGRTRFMVNVNGAPAVVTGCENLNASEAPVKVMINGQMYILRGEKMFDATGRLVK